MKSTDQLPRIDILLATYEGARHLPDLLASIDAQTRGFWRLIVRDDGSSDGTRQLLEEWVAPRSDRALILEDGRTGLGATGNFGALLMASDAPYFMFCDQDDVWLPHKIERMEAEMSLLERLHGTEVPLLVHSDLEVVNESLVTIHPSLWRYQRLFPFTARRPREMLIVLNYVTGCATLGNDALRRIVTPFPKSAVMHDWWVALTAGMLGAIAEIDSPTVRYRQHADNALGAQAWSIGGSMRRFFAGPSAAAERTRTVLSRTQAQAAAFLDRHGAALDPGKQAMIAEYAEIGAAGFWQRKSFLWRHQLVPESRLRFGVLTWFM